VELKELFRPLRQRWWLLVLAPLIAAIASIIATGRMVPTYRTQTTVLVGRAIDTTNPTNSDLALAQQLANTYAEVLRRQPVRTATMQTLGLSSLPAYTVATVPNTQLIELTVEDVVPERAKAVADELVRQLVLQSPSGLNPEEKLRQDFISKQLSELEIGIEETKVEIERRQEELAGLLSAREIADTQDEILVLQQKLGDLRANYGGLLDDAQSRSINQISIIEPAELPVRPVDPNRIPIILLNTAMGFVLAVAACYLMDYLDDTVHSPEEVQKIVSLPTLASVPIIEGAAADDEPIIVRQSLTPAAEAYRVLCTNLEFTSPDQRIRRVLIVSPTANEGKSTTAANLAAALAQRGQQVILLDADLRRPAIHSRFKLSNHVGLTTLLRDPEIDPESVLFETAVPGLRVLPTGPLPPNPSVLLASQRMRQVFGRTEGLADILVVDSPPVNLASDATVLATLVDGVVLVVRAGSSRRDDVKKAIENLSRVNARMLGAVLTHVPLASKSYYAYYRYNDTASIPAARRGIGRSQERPTEQPQESPTR
jgi:non-specific protein-tyrosine kinase